MPTPVPPAASLAPPSPVYTPPSVSPVPEQPIAPATSDTSALLGDQTQTPLVAGEPWKQRGLASWYGKRFNGRRTASGERFDPTAMTCAHKRYPFGSMLRVSSGDRSITCRVTDRGEFVRGRVIDLTPVAAKALGFSGLARVTVDPILKMRKTAPTSKIRPDAAIIENRVGLKPTVGAEVG